MTHTLKSLVIIPTYNERENIARLIEAIRYEQPDFDLLIVDDNSPDGTGQLVEEIAAQDSHVKVMHRPGKLGLGGAYLAGMQHGLTHGYDFMFEMDADFSHQPRYLADLLAAAQKTGVAVGSRLVAGGGVENWPWLRKLISRGGSFYSRTVLGLKTRDCTSGFKCFSRAVLQMLRLPEQVRSTGFGFQVEVNCLCEWNGIEVAEVPIIFPDRVLGKSKMSRKIFVEALLMVWRLRAARSQYLTGANPTQPSVQWAVADADANADEGGYF